MTNHPLIDTPSRTEKILRLADQSAENSPLCRTNLICLLEFDSADGKQPTLDDLRQLVKAKLPQLPSLRHYLDEIRGKFHWISYEPNLEKCITEITLPPKLLKNEMLSLLAGKLPYDAPWKVIYLSGEKNNKFSLLWCARHEVMDAGSFAALFNLLFSQSPQTILKLPSIEEALKSVPKKFLELSCSVEEAGLFFKNIPHTHERKLIALQMPSRLLPVIGKEFGISGNDLYLKAMGDAFWKWRHTHPENIPKGAKLPILVPINMRPPNNFAPGNRYFLARMNLPADFSTKTISQEMGIFRQKGMKENLATIFSNNPDIAMEQFPPIECLSAACSSFRVTKEMTWGSYRLGRMVYAFNAFTDGLPFYSMCSTYEPKNTENKNSVSTLFCSIDAGIKNLTKIPKFWREAVYALAKEANIDLSTFGEDPIKPFC